MSSAFKILPHYTYDDYEQWEGKWELIEGIPFAMSPSPVPEHQRIAGNLFTEFRIALRSCENGCKAYLPLDYKVKNDTILQPDMLVVCGAISKKFLDFPPSMVAEILSPSTAVKDRHTKFEIYQSEGIKYFLIINCDTEFVEIYELQNGIYALIESGREIEVEFCFDDCNIFISFSKIWN